MSEPLTLILKIAFVLLAAVLINAQVPLPILADLGWNQPELHMAGLFLLSAILGTLTTLTKGLPKSVVVTGSILSSIFSAFLILILLTGQQIQLVLGGTEVIRLALNVLLLLEVPLVVAGMFLLARFTRSSSAVEDRLEASLSGFSLMYLLFTSLKIVPVEAGTDPMVLRVFLTAAYLGTAGLLAAQAKAAFAASRARGVILLSLGLLSALALAAFYLGWAKALLPLQLPFVDPLLRIETDLHAVIFVAAAVLMFKKKT